MARQDRLRQGIDEISDMTTAMFRTKPVFDSNRTQVATLRPAVGLGAGEGTGNGLESHRSFKSDASIELKSHTLLDAIPVLVKWARDDHQLYELSTLLLSIPDRVALRGPKTADLLIPKGSNSVFTLGLSF
jgi:hypothetical protein